MLEKFGTPMKSGEVTKIAKDGYYYRAAGDARDDAQQGIHRTEAEVEKEAGRYRRMGRVASLASELHDECLPSGWKGRPNLIAEEIIAKVEEAIKTGMALDESFVEAASSVLHDGRLGKKDSLASGEQNKPYAELSDEDKKMIGVIIKIAIKVCRE